MLQSQVSEYEVKEISSADEDGGGGEDVEKKEVENYDDGNNESTEEVESVTYESGGESRATEEGNAEEEYVKSDLGFIIVDKSKKKLSDAEGDCDVERKRKCDGGSDDEDSIPPALPPRPPRPRPHCTCSCASEDADREERTDRRVSRSCWSSGPRKYVFLCSACGSLSILLGALFLTVYFMLKAYTSSLNHFETVPTYIPSGMLIATGFLIICLAWRKNRNSFLMKLCGLCSLSCAVLCVSVTVTTTVIHMNKLQTLRECLYTQKTQSCTCYAVLMDNNRISDEEVAEGSFEQLRESLCVLPLATADLLKLKILMKLAELFRGIKFVFNSTPDCEVIHGALYSCLRAIFGLSVIGILVCIFSCMLVYQLLSHEKKKMYWAQLEMRCRYLYRQQRNPHYYACCDECRYPPHPHELFPWELMRNRFWSTGRIGNLYTPNPEDRGSNRLRSAWNWRRLPWSRGGGTSAEPGRTALGSPDSQYGFSSTPAIDGAPYTVLDPHTTTGLHPCHPAVPGADITDGGFYSWGPPPPYASNRNSANNSPARRSLGDLLHHVSPVRRNDNVSPARNLHHVHRHHVHHTRQCSSSPRQVMGNLHNQSEVLQKTVPTTSSPLSNVIPRHDQPGTNNFWSDKISAPHRYQKIVQSKDNYENMYELENLPPGSGFNTLPSLKKKNQTRVSDIPENDSFTAYFYSSAENLGCSTSNTVTETSNHVESLPPRVSLAGEQGIASRYGPNNAPRHSHRVQPDASGSDKTTTKKQSIPLNSKDTSGASIHRTHRPPDRNSSLVRKSLVGCSPSKQKPINPSEPQIYSIEEKENFDVYSRRTSNKKVEDRERDSTIEPTEENVMTFRYRAGIPRSPNVRNFGALSDQARGGFEWVGGNKEGSGSESWSNDKTSGSENDQSETGKMCKNIKYAVKDAELLQKHSTLITEFNKTINLGKNFKCKNNKLENRRTNGIDNVGFQQAEESSEEVKRHYLKNFHGNSVGRSSRNQESSPGQTVFPTNGSETNENCMNGNARINENESDIYFADISNSSCYGPESLVYEETADERSTAPKFSENASSFLSRQNLKIIELENLDYNEIPSYGARSDGRQATENSVYKRRSTGNRHTGSSHQSSKPSTSYVDKQESSGKPRRRSFVGGSHYGETPESKEKYLAPASGRGPTDCLSSERHQESVSSNVDLSSNSPTTDSGISTGKGFTSKRFENPYQEIDSKSNESESGFEESTEFANKLNNFDAFGDFAHPLFQKPKVIPRGNRFKESEMVRRREPDVKEPDVKNNSLRENQTVRSVPFEMGGKAKNAADVDEGANQLVNACASPSPLYLDEEERSLHNFVKDDAEADTNADSPEEDMRKSPKPLPRTSAGTKNRQDANQSDHSAAKNIRFFQTKDGIRHFLAPDAQYEYKENLKMESKPKSPQKSKGSSQNSTTVKPIVPARPLNLQLDSKKAGKFETPIVRAANEAVRPLPRRRPNGFDESGGANVQIETHSVNV